MKESPLSTLELISFSRRSLLYKGFLGFAFFGFTWRLWNLQVLKGINYRKLSKGNRIRIKSIAAPRGRIYDNTGVILAKNIPTYNLVMIREDCPDIKKTVKKISRTLLIPTQDLLETINGNLHFRLENKCFWNFWSPQNRPNLLEKTSKTKGFCASGTRFGMHFGGPRRQRVDFSMVSGSWIFFIKSLRAFP